MTAAVMILGGVSDVRLILFVAVNRSGCKEIVEAHGGTRSHKRLGFVSQSITFITSKLRCMYTVVFTKD